MARRHRQVASTIMLFSLGGSNTMFSVKLALPLLTMVLGLSLLGVVSPSGSALPSASAAGRQVGATTLLPQIVQPGAKVVSSNRARLVGKIQFRPARRGRPVVIQRRLDGGRWQKVAVKRQARNGTVGFVAPARKAGSWYTYRGVARPWKGLGKVAAKPQKASIWQTRFRDEFNGSQLNRTKWDYRQVGSYSAASDRACSASSPDAVAVGGGRVALKMIPDHARQKSHGACRAPGESYSNKRWFKNGHISTQNAENGRFRYGVAAARVKFDRAQGAHGSFWMQSTVADIKGAGPRKDGAEIDVVEYFGKSFKKGDIYSFIHYKDARDRAHKVPSGTPITAARKALKRDDDWFKRYHVFSVQWTPNAYIFRVDGIRTLKVTRGVSRVPEFLILSMLSSGWEIEKLNGKLPHVTHVDWVRFWQK